MKLNMLKEFRKDEEGGILAFFLIMFLTLVVGGGMAVDFMNSEYQRERVQDALDRGVLAGAAIGKRARAVSAEEIAAAEAASVMIVESYLEKAGYDPEAAGVTITPNFTITSQRIDARSAFGVDTFFLRIAGIDSLGGNAASGAFVSQKDLEISLVLDVSGSMGFFGGSKIANLRTAGSEFVGNMLEGDRSDYTFISVLPFNHSVNIGADILSRFSNQMWHGYSGCATFSSSAYTSIALNPNSGLEQTGHMVDETKPAGQTNYLCDAGRSIVYSNNAGQLQTFISGLGAEGATAGYIGVKWAMALLDPSARPIVTSLIDDGLASAALTGKPSAYDDEDTLKFIVFMSDGEMNDAYQYYSPDYRQVSDSDGLLPANTIENADHWEDHPVDYNFNVQYADPNRPNPLQVACNTAKEDGRIVVFSIAYGNMVEAAQQDMEDCASTSGHYYEVLNPNDLDGAFTSIEATIHQLQLTN